MLELGRSLGDPVLIGDQRPQRRAPSPGPPDLPSGLTRTQQAQDSAVADASLLGDRARAQTRPRVPQQPLELPADDDETTGFLGVRAAATRRRGSATSDPDPGATVAPSSDLGPIAARRGSVGGLLG
jgi:hypothetical protein